MAFNFLHERDSKKIDKAGYATPRGGEKGGYQNHVVRSNQVIIPYERLGDVNLDDFVDGYVIRLFPNQYFSGPGQVHDHHLQDDATVIVGENAFVLYRTHDDLDGFPPLPEWTVRALYRDDGEVNQRSALAEDRGEYLLRLSNEGQDRPKRHEGPPQGVFAPEYADSELNYLCRCVLTWLIIRAADSPYVEAQADHLRSILQLAGLLDEALYSDRGALRSGTTSCPLCLKHVTYEELHSTISFEDEAALANAGIQTAGTRSTQVNLFHVLPLVYGELQHRPEFVAWGHATCNTRLGQRRCYSFGEMLQEGRKVAVIHDEGLETFGWISPDRGLIRSPLGAVWARIAEDWSPTSLVPDGDADAG